LNIDIRYILSRFADRFSGAVVHLTTGGARALPLTTTQNCMSERASKTRNARISWLIQAFQENLHWQ